MKRDYLTLTTEFLTVEFERFFFCACGSEVWRQRVLQRDVSACICTNASLGWGQRPVARSAALRTMAFVRCLTPLRRESHMR